MVVKGDKGRPFAVPGPIRPAPVPAAPVPARGKSSKSPIAHIVVYLLHIFTWSAAYVVAGFILTTETIFSIFRSIFRRSR